MKKIGLLFFTVVLSLVMFSLPAFAGTFDDLTYSSSHGEVEITGCSQGVSGTLSIPAEIEGMPVTSIGYNAFFYCKGLKTIIIPDTVNTIREDAFFWCEGLEEINIPESVTTIEEWAFYGCSKLSSVSILNSKVLFGDNVFKGCRDLTIYGYKDSTAEKYASDNKIDFELLAHSHQLTEHSVKEPTCTEMGNTVYWSCDICNIYFSDPKGLKEIEEDSWTIPALGHDWDNGTITKPATETEDGEITYTCSRCDDTKTEVIPKEKPTPVPSAGFIDVNIGSYYFDAVNWAYSNGITVGIAPYVFGPDNECTRGQIVTFLWNAAGKPDVTQKQNEEENEENKEKENIEENNVEENNNEDNLIENNSLVNSENLDNMIENNDPLKNSDPLENDNIPENSDLPGYDNYSPYNPFVDVNETAYYYKAVLWAVENGITFGVDETHFCPDDPCTRAQAVSFIWRVEDNPVVEGTVPFEDVMGSAYYYYPVLWAVTNGITYGVDPTHFAPDNTCTRAQIVRFLYQYMK